jgi:hypothetical protein
MGAAWRQRATIGPMSGTPFKPAPPVPTPRPRVVWVAVKDARSARCVEREHRLGRELVCILGPSGAVLWSRVFRPGSTPTLEEEAEASRQAFLSRGWTPAE